MIIRGRRRDTGYTLSLKPDSLSVAINTAMGQPPSFGGAVIVYDRAGRFYSLYQDSHYRRSLSGQVLQKKSGASGRQRRWLEHTEADQLLDAAADQLRRLLGALPAPDWQWLTPPDHPTQLRDLETVINRGARFDSAAARADAAQFARVYSAKSGRSAGRSPIGILPPDQYLALVVQATDGCSFNTCTFCDLYHQPFRVKTPDEFRQHIRQVRAYLGESMLLRQRSIFLGAANALAIPMARLVPVLEIIRDECHSEALRAEESLARQAARLVVPEIPHSVRNDMRADRIDKPTDQIDDPTYRIDKPTDRIDKPTDRINKPTDRIDKPTDQIDEPTDRINKPTDQIDEPIDKIGMLTARNDATRGVYAFLDAFTGARKSVEDYRVLAGLGLRRVYIGLESGHDPLLHFVKKPGRAADAIETVRSIKAAGINVGAIVLIGLGGDRFAEDHTRDTIDVLNQMQPGAGDLIYFSDLVEEAGTPYPLLAAQHDLRALNAGERAAQRAAIRSGLNLNGAKVSNYDVREFVY